MIEDVQQAVARDGLQPRENGGVGPRKMPIASFYFDVPLSSIIVGTISASILLVCLGLARNVLIGSLAGAIGCAIIAFVVVETGRGDMKLFTQLVWIPLSAIVGGAGAGIAAAIARRIAKSRTSTPNPSGKHVQDPREHPPSS